MKTSKQTLGNPKTPPISKFQLNTVYLPGMVLQFILPSLGEGSGSNPFTALTSSNRAPDDRLFVESIPMSFEFLWTAALYLGTSVYVTAELFRIIVTVVHSSNHCKVRIR